MSGPGVTEMSSPWIRGTIFDLGSTLIYFDGNWPDVIQDSYEFLADHLHATGLNIDPPTFQQQLASAVDEQFSQRMQDHIERPMLKILQEVLSEFGEKTPPESVLEQALIEMYAISEGHWQPAAGLHEMLDVLRSHDLPLGLISNASDAGNVQRLIDKAGIREYFDPILISAAVGYRKPSPEIFRVLLDTWKIPVERLVMVGDSLQADILGAQTVGIHQIWITAFLNDRPAEAGIHPEYETDTLQAIPDIVFQIGMKG